MKPKFILPILAIILFSCSQQETNEQANQEPLPAPQTELVNEEVEQPEALTAADKPEKVQMTKSAKQEDFTYSFASIQDFYKANETPTQVYNIKSNRDTVIKGAKGTEVLVRRNSFVDGKGNAVTEPVEIAMKEYTSMEDFIFNGMHSTSEGQLLETGGMFHITATANGEEVYLRKGQTISLKIPTDEKKEGMQYFRGVETEDGLDWVAENSVTEPVESNFSYSTTTITSRTERISFEVSSGNRYYYGKYGYNWARPRCLKCDEYFNKAITYPKTGAVNQSAGVATARFVIQIDGSVKNLQITGPVGEDSKALIQKAIESYTNWIPEIVEGNVLRPYVELRYSFQFNNSNGKFTVFHPEYDEIFNVMNEAEYADAKSGVAKYQKEKEEFQANMKNGSDETIKSFYNKGQASNYILEASTLGFINCDRFGNYPPGALTSLKVNKDGGFNDVKLVFSNIRSIMQGWPSMDECVFQNIPAGEKVTVIGIKEGNGEAQFAFKEMEIGRNQTIDLEYKPITYKELKEQIARLN